MLNLYVAKYDISDPKRLQRAYKTICNCGEYLQLSVFECQLSGKDPVLLKDKLAETIDRAADQVLFVRLGPVRSEFQDPAIEALGRPYTPWDYTAVGV